MRLPGSRPGGRTKIRGCHRRSTGPRQQRLPLRLRVFQLRGLARFTSRTAGGPGTFACGVGGVGFGQSPGCHRFGRGAAGACPSTSTHADEKTSNLRQVSADGNAFPDAARPRYPSPFICSPRSCPASPERRSKDGDPTFAGSIDNGGENIVAIGFPAFTIERIGFPESEIPTIAL